MTNSPAENSFGGAVLFLTSGTINILEAQVCKSDKSGQMSMQKYDGFEVVYREMIEGQDDSFAHAEPMIFHGHKARGLSNANDSQSLQAAADAWACWMRSQGHEVLELPRTTRTRECGLTFSVTAQGEESRIFVVTCEK